MTNDSAKPETVSDSAKPESFRSHLPAIVAATAGTVTAAVLGSLLGTAGTIAGMAIASLTAGTLSWWAERGIRRSAAMATARAEAMRARGRHLYPNEVAVAGARSTGRPVHAGGDDDAVPEAAARHDRGRPRRRWAVPVAVAAAAFIGCAVPLTLLEHAAGKPLSAIVQGEPGHGTTLGGGGVGKPAPSRTPSPSPSTTGSAATATASGTAPGGTSSSPAASPTPDATASGSTSPSPTGSATGSATPAAAPTTPAPG